MGELLVSFFILVAVLSVSAVLFGGWLTVIAAKGVGRLAALMFAGVMLMMWPRRKADRTCGRCHAANPQAARFCRRCGRPVNGSD